MLVAVTVQSILTMAHNLTLNSSDVNDYSLEGSLDLLRDFNYVHPKRVDLYPACLLIFIIIPGLLFNILAFAIIVKRRMCLDHEGFVYLAAIQLINITVTVYELTPIWISSFSQTGNILISSGASCKTLVHVDHVMSSTSGWLVAAMLFNVYLRRRSLTEQTKTMCGCTDFPAKYCTLFGAGFATGSIVFDLVVGCFWLIPFTQYIDKAHLSYCHLDLPPSYGLWAFVIEQSPVLVLTPVLLLALGYVALGSGDTNAPSSSSNAIEGSGSSDAKDFGRASIGVAAANLLLRSPIFIMKLMLPRDAHRHWLHLDLIFFSLNTLSHVNIVVMPIVCLATISGMREVITSFTGGRKCSECRCAGSTSA